MQLKKKHVTGWVEGRGYNPTSQNKAIGAIKRAFQWAVEEEYIRQSPIAHVRKPTVLVRDRILTPNERRLILSSIKGQAFRHFVLAMTLTGCRPGEVARLRRENVDLQRGVWEFANHKTARQTGRKRTVYLCPEAIELTKRRLENLPDGAPVFGNIRNGEFTSNAIRCRFRQLRRKHPQLEAPPAQGRHRVHLPQ
jgi:integrase